VFLKPHFGHAMSTVSSSNISRPRSNHKKLTTHSQDRNSSTLLQSPAAAKRETLTIETRPTRGSGARVAVVAICG
jgi:hypothetical protein